MHVGLERLLRDEGIDKACATALKEFELQARSRGLELQPNEDAYVVYNEQRALLEALLRAWAIVRLPSFLEEYEVVDLEKEELWKIDDQITFMARADGLLRNRSLGDLYLLSFKTAKQYDKKRSDEARSDIQGISELVAIEERVGERVQGVQMEYLIKGRRDEWPKGSGIYQTSNPLIRPWIGPNERYAHSWYWEDLDGRHTLGSRYRKVPIWETMPIASWISLLDSGTIQPEAGSCLQQWIVSPLPYNRNRGEVESWKVQATEQAREMATRGAEAEGERENGDFNTALDRSFPQHRHSCHYPTRCPFVDVCFGGCGPEPELSGRFVWREPHHEAEQQELENA